MIAMGMTWMTTWFYLGAVAVELAGSLSLLLGYRALAGAWLLNAPLMSQCRLAR